MDKKLLQGRHTPCLFLFALVLLFTVSFLVKTVILPRVGTAAQGIGPFEETWLNAVSYLLDVLTQTSLTTLVLSAAFLLLVPRDLREGQVVSLHPRDIAGSLEENLSQTDSYWFRGRSGRWFRSQALPRLQKSARAKGRTISVNILLPNPDNNDLMSQYANYRNSIQFTGSKNQWTAKSIRQEILATIVSAYYTESQNNMINIKIGLLDMFSLARLDITTQSAVLTREDPTAPGLRFAAGSALYDLYREEVTQGIVQGRELPAVDTKWRSDVVDKDFVFKALAHAGLNQLTSTAHDQQAIAKRVLEPENPYG